MLVKTILNTIEKFKTFVYGKIFFEKRTSRNVLIIELQARKNSQGECCDCGTRCPTYDTQPSRDYEYVPLWGITTYFRYSPR
jgi:transposase